MGKSVKDFLTDYYNYISIHIDLDSGFGNNVRYKLREIEENKDNKLYLLNVLRSNSLYEDKNATITLRKRYVKYLLDMDWKENLRKY